MQNIGRVLVDRERDCVKVLGSNGFVIFSGTNAETHALLRVLVKACETMRVFHEKQGVPCVSTATSKSLGASG
jgi:hypothetical protein